MLKRFFWLFALGTMMNATATEIDVDQKSGSLILRAKHRTVVYEDVVGEKNGFDRSLILINGSPALSVFGRDSFYYTLITDGEKIYIDCAYSDVRNIENGAKVAAGACGLARELGEGFEEVAQEFANIWQRKIYGFDTQPLYRVAGAHKFLLGRIGEIAVYDRYLSTEELENATPQKYIKSSNGCFNFGASSGFLVFLEGGSINPVYLDLLKSEDPLTFERLDQDRLKLLAGGDCD
jgi:hypothetical protein